MVYSFNSAVFDILTRSWSVPAGTTTASPSRAAMKMVQSILFSVLSHDHRCAVIQRPQEKRLRAIGTGTVPLLEHLESAD
jgi:hypothetical protein